MSLRSRSGSTATAAAATAILLIACGAPDTSGAEDRDDGVIRVGLVAPFTGPLAAAAEDLEAGWELYWKERGNTKVAGTEVEWYTADDANDPATGVTQTKALVSQRNVDFVVGPVTSAVGSAVGEEMARAKVPVFVPVLSDDNITQRSPIEGMVRIAGWTASQVTHPLGAWTYDQGYKKVTTLCFDMTFGYEHCGGFVNAFTDKGGTIGEQLWQQLGEQDYTSFITQIRDSNPDAVFLGTSGSDSVRFVQAWSDFGLKDEIPLIVTETVTDQSNLRSMKDDAIGIISAGHYAEGMDSPANEQFVEAFQQEYNRLPSYFAAAMFSAADWLVKGIEEVDGDVTDTEAFVDAVKAITLADSPLGELELDSYNNTILNIYIREAVKREDGEVWNVVRETIPEVSQFWEYDPEEYLDHPAYSRDYQGNGVWPDPKS